MSEWTSERMMSMHLCVQHTATIQPNQRALACKVPECARAYGSAMPAGSVV